MVQVHLGPPNISWIYDLILRILSELVLVSGQRKPGFLSYRGSGVSLRHEKVAVTHPSSRCRVPGLPQGHRSSI